MKAFTDDEMNQLQPAARPYSVVILRQGPKFGEEAAPSIVWEHGRRNFALRDEGVLAGHRRFRCLRHRGVRGDG
ncbi:hypothetical protein MGAST_04740 [Mycobacterium gastri 'Wayne']|nr:hypothetical protein MGAST_04740 [Mycobacterium gastri 'Wayne']